MIANFLQNASEKRARAVPFSKQLLEREEIVQVLKAEHGRVKELADRMKAFGRPVKACTISLWLSGRMTSGPIHLFASNFANELIYFGEGRRRRPISAVVAESGEVPNA